MKLSVVTPVHNEEGCIKPVVGSLIRELKSSGIEYEIVLINDNSTDSTPRVLNSLAAENEGVKIVEASPPKGFGRAIRKGLDNVSGDVVIIYMGDGSDDPEDAVKYYNKIAEGYDCVFGSRFIKGSRVTDYPKLKLMLNRLGNKFIQMLFLIKYNDVSNAFKAYRIGAIRSVQPLVSQYFNITVELPLKVIIRGFSFAVVPINWNGRGSGVSKYNIKELGRKYFFSILFVWLEKILLKEEIRSSP
ncbi:MAG: glycosyltransferase family 2 protein [Candidatus Omnitrophica bacterium]|nr:glycosyltransferase family 2 protein [Candidatus Omnitrophota bacterium]MDD5553967.1 glycosyltransferase family 2 protein [Candidatus Omnitrophota bacterium]